MHSYAIAAVSFFLSTLHAYTLPPRQEDRACNNSPLICSKPYDTVTHLGAHDSPFLRDSSTKFSSFGNQYFNTSIQLSAGVRLLTTQVHASSNAKTGERELHVCHSSCALFDAGPLSKWLLEIRNWLDGNPNEVVTLVLVNMNGVDARELEGVYSQADIAHYGYIPFDSRPPPLSNQTKSSWPTLGKMIDDGSRLVSFVQPLRHDRENAPYLLDQFTFMYENPYDVTEPGNFTCLPDRPVKKSIAEMQESGRMFLMNHMLYWKQAFGIEVPDHRNIETTNAWEGEGALGKHMIQCGTVAKKQPTFVLVDFFNVGPAIASVDTFNKVHRPVGRLSVTGDVLEPGMGKKKASNAARARAGRTAVWTAIFSTIIVVLVL